MPDRDLDVVLYGATGYTGRLIAHALASHDVTFAVAGRDGAKLAALSDALDAKPETIVAGVDDADALRAMAARTRVVVSAAGPFVKLGPPVLDAALDAGAHFVDITGEQAFLRRAFEAHGRAKDAGLTVVNAMGFDVVPSDYASVLAARDMAKPETLDVCIKAGAGMSAGTRKSAAANAGQGWWFDHGQFRTGPPGRFTRTTVFPDVGERACVFIPWGDVVTAPRSTGARVVRTFFTMKPERARLMRLTWPVTAISLRAPMIKEKLKREAARAREGPTDAEREKARFAIVAEATDDTGRVQRGVVTGRDPYGLTGASAALAAVKLARGEVSAHGVLTPSQAFDLEAFVKALPERFEVQGRVE